MSSPRTYEIVVHGATGFTGTLVCEYLCQIPNVRWAVSGRSLDKLEAVKGKLENVRSAPDVIALSIDDKEKVLALAKSTKVILSTAGPFAKIGTPIVEACLAAKTDYCDITGEIVWVREMMDRFGAEAEKKGVLLVSCCGFDSAPSDLSTLYGVQKLREKYGASTPIKSATSYVIMQGGLSGGTLASGINMEKDPEMSRRSKDPFLLCDTRPTGGVRSGDEDIKSAQFDQNIGSWTGPFGMATINTRIVRRSNEILGYSPEFMYNEVQLADSEKAAQRLAKGGPPASKREEMVQKGRLPAPGQGPSAEMRAKSYFRVFNHVVAADDPTRSVYVKVAGGDPGYTETAKMVAESALCLARQRTVLPRTGGYLTPAAAMGSHLIERLVKSGISFEQIESPADANVSKAKL